MNNFSVNNYKELKELLYAVSGGEEFCAFQKKIVNTEKQIIGVKAPVLRKLAKQIVKDGKGDIFKNSDHQVFEEIMLEGLTLAEIKNREEAIVKFNSWFEHMDNWGVVDIVVGSVKFLKDKSKTEENYQYLLDLLESDNEFVIRFGIVGLMKYFIGEKHLWKTIDAIDNVKCNKYYVEMAISWLISEVLIKNPQNAQKNMQKILKNNHFNKFIINKSIQKACESFRIDIEIKNKLRELKIK